MRWGVALSFLLLSTTASAAPPTTAKRCIAAAETGQTQQRNGQLVSARKTFVACTQSECPPVVRKDCARWIEDLEKALPTVVLKPQDENGNDVAGGKVTIDGEEAESTSRAIPIDPGNHHVEWVREEGTIGVDIVVREGERNRIVEIRPKKKEQPKEKEEPRKWERSPVPFVVGGLGVVASAIGGTLWGIGLSDRANLVTSCAPTHACSADDVDASKTKLVVGDVLFGIGVVAVVTAVVLFVRDTPPGKSTTAAIRW